MKIFTSKDKTSAVATDKFTIACRDVESAFNHFFQGKSAAFWQKGCCFFYFFFSLKKG